MEGDDVRLPEQVLQGRVGHPQGLLRLRREPEGVVVEDPAFEAVAETLGHGPAYVPPPDEADRLSPELVAPGAELPLEPLPGAQGVVGQAKPLVDGQHQGDGGLGDGHGIGASGDADGDTPPRRRLQVDLVDADAVLLDQPKSAGRLDHRAGYRRPGAEDVVGVPGLLDPLLFRRRVDEKKVEPFRLLPGH